MAEKRMFAKTIIDSDEFLDMPQTTQNLYFHLGMRADDDGFLNNAKKIMRTIGANQNDYDVLLAKQYIIQFEKGICVIKHWRINNYLRSDRYKETIHTNEKSLLQISKNGIYEPICSSGIPLGIPQVDQLETQYSIDKSSIDKNSIEKVRSHFVPPSFNEVNEYCVERKNKVDPQHFIDFYISKGWMIGKNKMKDWKAAVRTWEKRSNENKSKGQMTEDEYLESFK